MSVPEIELDHPRLDTVVRLCKPGETDPRWEVTACTNMGTVLPFDGNSGARLITVLDGLLDTPTTIAKVSLILWVPR